MPYKLIVIEDREELRQNLCKLLPWSSLGFEVSADFGDGTEALRYLTSHPVDVALMDIVMPGISGLDLVRLSREAGCTFPCVLLSAHQDFAYAREAMRYGVRDYLIKPVTFEDIQTTFARIAKELDALSEGDDFGKSLNRREKIVRLANEYVLSHLSSATLESTAAHLNMNASYFSRLYHQCTQVNFSDFVFRSKMEKAADLLRDARHKNQDISEMLGYSNPNNFIRAFCRFYGKSPSVFRNK